MPARSSDHVCLVSGCCSSGRDFAPRFLQTVPRSSALALHSCFTSIRLHRGLSPPGCRTCPAHRTLHAACGGARRASLTAARRTTLEVSGRDEETAASTEPGNAIDPAVLQAEKSFRPTRWCKPCARSKVLTMCPVEPWPGHPRLAVPDAPKSWMAAVQPVMTQGPRPRPAMTQGPWSYRPCRPPP